MALEYQAVQKMTETSNACRQPIPDFYPCCKQNAARKLKQSYQMIACNRLSHSSCVATTIVYTKQRKLCCERVSCKVRAPMHVPRCPIYSNPSWTKYT